MISCTYCERSLLPAPARVRLPSLALYRGTCERRTIEGWKLKAGATLTSVGGAYSSFANGMLSRFSQEALYSVKVIDDPWSTFLRVRMSLPLPLVTVIDDPWDCLCDGWDE